MFLVRMIAVMNKREKVSAGSGVMDQVSAAHTTQLTLLGISDKLDRVLSAVQDLELRITELEVSRNGSTGVPSILPKTDKSLTLGNLSAPPRPDKKRLYSDDIQKPPPLPLRNKGNFFTPQQCEFMRSELKNVKNYVDGTKAKQSEDKWLAQGRLNSIMSTLQPGSARKADDD